MEDWDIHSNLSMVELDLSYTFLVSMTKTTSLRVISVSATLVASPNFLMPFGGPAWPSRDVH